MKHVIALALVAIASSVYVDTLVREYSIKSQGVNYDY